MQLFILAPFNWAPERSECDKLTRRIWATVKSAFLKEAFEISAPLKFTPTRHELSSVNPPVMKAPLKLAPVKSEFDRLAPKKRAWIRWASLKSHPVRFACLRFASLAFAWASWDSDKLQPLKLAPRRFVPLRSVPERFWSLSTALLKLSPVRSYPERLCPIAENSITSYSVKRFNFSQLLRKILIIEN